MTADVEAAAPSAPFDPIPTEERFTLSEERQEAATREQWSLGDDAIRDQDGHHPRRTERASLPKGLFITAGLLALLAVVGVLKLDDHHATPQSEPSAAGSGSAPADGTPEGSAAPLPSAPKEAPSRSRPASEKRISAVPPAAAPATAAVPNPTSAAGKPPAPLPDFDGRMREGRAALAKGDLTIALASFEAAVAIRPLSAEALTGIARCQAGNEDTAAAIKTFERAVAANPDYSPAWSGLAHLRETAGNRDGAIDAYRRVIAINPNSRDAKTARDALTDLGATEP